MADTLVIDDLDERRLHGVGGVQMDAMQTLLSRVLKPVEENTDRVSLKTLDGLELPHPADRLDPKLLSPTPAIAEEVAIAASRAGVVADPNPGLEGLKAALLYERRGMSQLRGTEDETRKHLKAIDQMLDLSTELATLDDKDKHELSAKMQEILKELKEQGIDLHKGDPKNLTREQLLQLKSALGGKVDNERTKVQQVFTKMQSIIQNIMSVNDSGKRMISEFVQLLRTITKNMRP